MELMSPLDSVFLMTESREHPMHVGGLQLFQPPEGAGPDYVREAHDALVANRDFQPTFRKHPAWTFGAIPSVAWTYDDPDDVDVDYAVRMATFGSFFHQGQICLNTRKIIIQRGIYDEFLSKFVERTRTLPTGDPLDPATIIGPLVTQAAVDLMD